MQTPLQITFRHMLPSIALEASVRKFVSRLEHLCDRILGCHVVIEAPAGHRNKGAPFEVKIDLTVPGAEICVRSDHGRQEAHTDAYVALRDAFAACRRMLKEHLREYRGDTRQSSAAQSET